MRQLITTTPKQVQRYKQEVHDNITKEPFISDVQMLTDKLNKNSIQADDITLIDRIDTLFSTIRLNAEKHLKKKISHTTHHGQKKYI